MPLAARRERVNAEVARLIALRATKIHVNPDAEQTDHYGVLMNDPEGNEFCIA